MCTIFGMDTKSAVGLIKNTFSAWSEDKAPRLGAALAYYAVFSIPPLILIVVTLIGLVYKGDVAGAIQQQMATLIGEDAARTMMSSGTQEPSSGYAAGIVSIILLLFGATGVFGELQDSLNTVWKVRPKPGRQFKELLKDRFLSFTMVAGIAFLLMVSLVVSAALAAVGGALGAWIPGGEIVGQIIENAITLGVLLLLFAFMFKFLPDAKIAWNDVWIGAAVTAVLFTLGKLVIGLYLGKGAVGSSYGAAGSVIVMIVWVYYSAQILLFGAEFTRVYANAYGSHVVPAENAEPVTPEQRAEEGLSGKTPTAPEPAAQQRAVEVHPSGAPPSVGVAAAVAMLAGFLLGRTRRPATPVERDDTGKAA